MNLKKLCFHDKDKTTDNSLEDFYDITINLYDKNDFFLCINQILHY